ncbi:type II secretion system protein [Fortiea sp. LEGE XX443]|uniref:hormogonium polysaccharide secretion pseudopilin HpsB n=1 Tax=Fortiea sp. LEGE XX443 TaxID=1828611 RepID=UPI001881D2FD|nr:hormogonium polysaccharide secretion pseudopilin HpsB [Fortiea sp. LEGE XX443]MBE9004027.1 type II secretion system protein [Fortiea sp. LEGE XX443]
MIGKQQITEAAKKAISDIHNEGGFTIVESLVAIFVATILLAAIAPVITLSVATRVQSRRVELATQAAKAYIDTVRTQKIAAPPESGTNTLSNNPAPTATGTLTCSASNSYCTAPTTPTTSALYCVDFDSTNNCETNSLTDVVVQAFRYNSNNSNSNPAITGYTLGLRVYRADAFKSSATLLKNTATSKVTQRTFTAGTGQRTAPVVEMTADISDIVPKYSDLCARFSGGCN